MDAHINVISITGPKKKIYVDTVYFFWCNILVYGKNKHYLLL